MSGVTLGLDQLEILITVHQQPCLTLLSETAFCSYAVRKAVMLKYPYGTAAEVVK